MSSISDTIIQYLREAQALQQGQASLLDGQLRGTPPGPYRSAVRRHRDAAERHVQLIADRLTDLGAGEGLLQVGLNVVEGLAGRLVGAALAPLNVFVSRTPADAVLRNAQDTVAGTARALVSLGGLERLAQAAGDATTASLARALREEVEQALEAFRQAVPDLADRVARERFGRAAPRGEAPAPAPAAVDVTELQRRDAPRRAADPAPRGAAGPEAGPERGAPASAPGPETEAPAREPETGPQADTEAPAREPAAGPEPEPARPDRAGQRNGGPVVTRDEEPADEREETERDEELVARESDGVPGPELHVQAPWEGYDEMTAAQILERLRDADGALVTVVLLYEQTHKQRKSVLRRAQRA